MTTTAEPRAEGALDVRTFLLGDGDGSLHRRVGSALQRGKDSEAFAVLRGPVRKALEQELATAVEGFLAHDLGTVAMRGWRLHGQLVRSGRATAATPGLVELVELAKHTITSDWKPSIEVRIGSLPLAEIELSLTLTFTVVGLRATVTGGRLIRISGGHGTVKAVLTMSGQVLAERSSPFDAGVSVALGPGLLLSELPQPRTSPSVIDLTDPVPATTETPTA